MMMQAYHRQIIATLIILLLAAGAMVAKLRLTAAATTVPFADQAVVKKAQADAHRAFTTQSIDGKTRLPIVLRMSDRICVELRPFSKDRAGTYLACYDNREGKLIEERVEGGY